MMDQYFNTGKDKMKKLEIAFIVPSFPETSETFIVNQITDLIDRGHKVSIFAFTKNEDAILHQRLRDYDLMSRTIYYEESFISRKSRYWPFLKFLFKNYTNIDYINFFKNFNWFKYRNRAFNLRFFYFYYWILKQNVKYDIFHAHFGDMGKFVAIMKQRGFFSRSGLVTTFHGYDLAPDLLETFKTKYQPLFREADLLTVNSPYSKVLLKTITHSEKVKILPVALDTETFKRHKIIKKNTVFTILFVGRLIEIKAPEKTLKILNDLISRGHEQIRLVIIGDGEKRNDLETMIRALDLQDCVKLKGALPQEKIITAMEAADVFLLPGIYDKTGRAETQGLVIQEAQAMELPVIVSDVGGMKYGLVEGETGFIVKEHDLKAFADKIEFLIKNETIRKEMGKKGRKLVVKNYDSRVLGKRLEKYYLEIVKHY